MACAFGTAYTAIAPSTASATDTQPRCSSVSGSTYCSAISPAVTTAAMAFAYLPMVPSYVVWAACLVTRSSWDSHISAPGTCAAISGRRSTSSCCMVRSR